MGHIILWLGLFNMTTNLSQLKIAQLSSKNKQTFAKVKEMIHDLNYDLIFHCSHNLLWVPEYECVQCLEYSGCITLVTVFASWTTCAISVKGGETFTYSERNNGAGWLYLQQKLREKFHIHEYIRQPETQNLYQTIFTKERPFIIRFFTCILDSLVLLIEFVFSSKFCWNS